MSKFLSKKMMMLVALLCVGISPAEEPDKLPRPAGTVVEEYARKRADGITRLNMLCIDKLEVLKAKFMKSANLGGANAADSEIAKLQWEIDALNVSSSVYRDGHEGLAGLPRFNKDTTYKFEVSSPAKAAKLVLYAQIVGGRDSRGGIVWKTPDDPKGRKVGTWSGSSTSPIVIEIPEGCSESGEYAVEFQYEGGDNPLRILSAELRTGAGTAPTDDKKELPLSVGVVVEEYAREKKDGITRLNKIYLEKLDVVKAQFMKSNNLDGANAAQGEINRLRTEIESLRSDFVATIKYKGASRSLEGSRWLFGNLVWQLAPKEDWTVDEETGRVTVKDRTVFQLSSDYKQLTRVSGPDWGPKGKRVGDAD